MLDSSAELSSKVYWNVGLRFCVGVTFSDGEDLSWWVVLGTVEVVLEDVSCDKLFRSCSCVVMSEILQCRYCEMLEESEKI